MLRIWGLGFRAYGLGWGVEGVRILGLGPIQNSGFRI